MTEFTANRTNTGNGNGHNGNGHHGVGVADLPDEETIVLEEDEVGEEGRQDRRRVQVVDEGDFVDELAGENGAGQGRRKGRKVGVGVVLIVVILGVAMVAFGFMRSKKATVPVKKPNTGATQAQSEDQLTRDAINEATSGSKTPGNVTLPANSVIQPQQNVDSNVPVTQMPPGLNPNLSSTVPSSQTPVTPESAGQGPQQSANTAAASQPQSLTGSAGGRNSERSVSIMDAPAVAAGGPSDNRGRQTARGNRETPAVSPEGVALPTFGSMLPVRSLGALYTLRSGSLARFELTRDIGGRGWSMKKGTVLVGALRGSEYDRAYVALVGFIDSDSGRFIRVSGDVLGTDGASGIRGKKRKIGSSWASVFSKIGEAGLNIASGLAGSVGRRPIIIADAYGSSGRRVTNELDNVLLNRNRREFVEVAAGTSGFIMVTDLPETVQGVDALAQLSARDVEERADVGQRRQATGISESEMADLIQSGDSNRIREALPKMTPDMRRVAEAVLNEGGGQ